ncbi:MAG TPA: hypothetical protein VJ045_08900 [Hyphomicrobiaceae bacterium]|nr:hypothetical protein [Hyphomicrobiaceae bacterium]
MLDTLGEILNADLFSFAVAASLTIVAALLMRAMCATTTVALSFAPAIGIGALSSIYACRQAALLFTYDHNSNIVIAAVIGMIAGFFAMLIMMLLVRTLAERRRPATQPPAARA